MTVSKEQPREWGCQLEGYVIWGQTMLKPRLARVEFWPEFCQSFFNYLVRR